VKRSVSLNNILYSFCQQVARVEVDDGEWLQELESEFQSSGFLPTSAADSDQVRIQLL